MAAVARGGTCRRWPAQGDARALPVGRNDVLAGQLAGRQRQEQRSEPGLAHVLIDARLMVGCSRSVLGPDPV